MTRIVSILLIFVATVTCEPDEKTKQMIDWQRRSGQDGTIKLNKADFKKYVQSKTQYHTVVMFTALLNDRGCAICQDATNEYHVMSNSQRWTGSLTDKLFFVTIDYDAHGGSDIFNQMKLTTAPAFYVFSPDKKLLKADKLDVQKIGYMAESMSKWVQERSGIEVKIYRPPNHSSTGIFLIFALSAVAVIYLKWDAMLEFMNKDSISWILISACLAFISGQVWNSIRGPQYLMRARGGGIGFIYPSSQHQLIAETHIVLILYGMMTGGVIFMVKGGEKGVPAVQRPLILTGAGMLAVGYGLMLNVFKRKYQGYPYSFFLG